MSEVIRVVAGLFRRGDRVLVQQRPEGRSQAGLWEFPGGKVEPGEGDDLALVRECKEELGVDIEVGPQLWSNLYEYREKTIELVLYRAEIANDHEPRALDEQQVLWADPHEMGQLEFCPADVPAVDAILTARIR